MLLEVIMYLWPTLLCNVQRNWVVWSVAVFISSTKQGEGEAEGEGLLIDPSIGVYIAIISCCNDFGCDLCS